MRLLKSSMCVVFVLSIALCGLLPRAALARQGEAAQVPRYRFAKGQELVYEGVRRAWCEKKEPADLSVTWHLWVVGVDEQGQADVVVEYCAKKEEEVQQRYLFRRSVDPQGKLTWDRSCGAIPAWLTLRRIVPQLPTAEEFDAGNWEAVESRSGLRWDYSATDKEDSKHLQIKAVCKGPVEDVSVGSQQCTFEFDLAAGRVNRTDFGGFWKDSDEREEESLALTSAVEHDESWVATFRDDVDRYFNAVEEHRQLVGRHDLARLVRVEADGGLADRLADARALLTAAQSANREPELEGVYDEQLQAHDERAVALRGENGTAGRVETTASIVDQPSPAWSAEDLAGESHQLADYRGKIVVLDVWFRKCNDCIRAQPQLDSVVENFKDKPVVFLGVNTDEDAEDAEFAAKQLKLPYPSLRGLDVKKLYACDGAPTWIVIDGKGIVRAVHVGYSGLLREELTDTLNELLKASAPATEQPMAANGE